MLIVARTAPKSGGVDDILTSIVYGEEKEAIAEKMEKTAEEQKIEGFRVGYKKCWELGGSRFNWS